jgi:hypothetical protein
MESPDALLARLRLGREEYVQRLLTMLIVGGGYPPWNSRQTPSELGIRFLRLLEQRSFGDVRCRVPYAFVDEFDLGRRPQDLRASAPDWAVITEDRLWVIELKTERGSHRPSQVPNYVATALHHHPARKIDLTYLTGAMPLYTPQLSPGTRFAHLTWDAVVPIVESVWGAGTQEQREAAQRIGEVLASLDIPWPVWRHDRLEQMQKEISMTTKDTATSPDRAGDPVEKALELARLTAADHEQRAIDCTAGSLEQLREFGLAVRDALYDDGAEALSHVLPWMWNVETSTGAALTSAGAEVGYELRLSWYDKPVGRAIRSRQTASLDKPPAALCPIHFIELPAAGVCDLCE